MRGQSLWLRIVHLQAFTATTVQLPTTATILTFVRGNIMEYDTLFPLFDDITIIIGSLNQHHLHCLSGPSRDNCALLYNVKRVILHIKRKATMHNLLKSVFTSHHCTSRDNDATEVTFSGQNC